MVNESLPPERLDLIIRAALDEDLGQGDVTGDTMISADLKGQARLLAKESGGGGGNAGGKPGFLAPRSHD